MLSYCVMPPVRKGVSLHVEETGQGLPLVLTHGLGDRLETWDAIVGELASHHRVLRWDLRGHGRSDAPDDPAAYSAQIAVGDLIDVIERAGDAVALVGHSLGGYLSLVVALRHPELVR